jgi:hypothetical protein
MNAREGDGNGDSPATKPGYADEDCVRSYKLGLRLAFLPRWMADPGRSRFTWRAGRGSIYSRNQPRRVSGCGGAGLLAGKGLKVERNKGNINDFRCRKGQQTMKNGGAARRPPRRQSTKLLKLKRRCFAGSHHYLFIYLFIFV